MKIDWVRKLTSRKFWVAVSGFVTALMVLMNVDALTQEHVIGLISATSVLIAYILGESYVDGKYAKPEKE